MPLLARPTAEERRRALPGDGFVPNPAATVMHAVTIRAAPECVWPWLAQMGAGRAGWYSYDWIDNGGRPSATEVIPELQHIAMGDVMPALPGARDVFLAAAVEPGRDLVLTVAEAGGGVLVSWEFFLEPHASGARLLARGRVGAKWPGGAATRPASPPRPIERVYALLAVMPRWMMAPIARLGHGVMQRRQLSGIKCRAEGLAAKTRASETGDGR
jgi:hypothetical protein